MFLVIFLGGYKLHNIDFYFNFNFQRFTDDEALLNTCIYLT